MTYFDRHKYQQEVVQSQEEADEEQQMEPLGEFTTDQHIEGRDPDTHTNQLPGAEEEEEALVDNPKVANTEQDRDEAQEGHNSQHVGLPSAFFSDLNEEQDQDKEAEAEEGIG